MEGSRSKKLVFFYISVIKKIKRFNIKKRMSKLGFRNTVEGA